MALSSVFVYIFQTFYYFLLKFIISREVVVQSCQFDGDTCSAIWDGDICFQKAPSSLHHHISTWLPLKINLECAQFKFSCSCSHLYIIYCVHDFLVFCLSQSSFSFLNLVENKNKLNESDTKSAADSKQNSVDPDDKKDEDSFFDDPIPNSSEHSRSFSRSVTELGL